MNSIKVIPEKHSKIKIFENYTKKLLNNVN